MQPQPSETQLVPVTPIRKLLGRLPSLRRKRSSRTKSRRSVPEGDVSTTNPTWSDFPRRQILSNGNLCARTSTHTGSPAPHCPSGLTLLKSAQLAIQQHDYEHDAIVVSTLPYYPFCCHQDLLTMSRPRLLQTAYLFNSCLPFNTRFTDLEVSSDAYIRLRIEEVVGIVSGPTDDIRRGDNDVKAISCELDMEITRPSTPLAMYPSVFSPPRYLDVLVEEDESDFSSFRRTVKRRKADSGKAEPSQVFLDYGSWDGL